MTTPRTSSFLLLAGAMACSGKADDTADTGAPAEEVLVWAGWNHRWNLLSHRVSAERAILTPDGDLDLGMIGGDWSTGEGTTDYPLYRMHLSRVRGAGISVVHGQTDAIVGPDGVLATTESIDAPGVTAHAHQVVVLRGIDITTDVAQGDDYPDDYDPFLGYCSRGFGFAVGAPTVDGDTVSFDVSGSVRWGPAGPEDPLYEQRQKMNAAIPYAHTGVGLAWTVIGYDGDLAEISGSGGVDYPNGVYSDQPPLGAADLGMVVSGLPTPGFPAIRGFDLAVEVPENPGQGEYLRSVGVELPAEGGDVALATEATNSSLVETAAIRFTADLDTVWVDLGPAGGSVEAHTAEGQHEVGFTTIPAE